MIALKFNYHDYYYYCTTLFTTLFNVLASSVTSLVDIKSLPSMFHDAPVVEYFYGFTGDELDRWLNYFHTQACCRNEYSTVLPLILPANLTTVRLHELFSKLNN